MSRPWLAHALGLAATAFLALFLLYPLLVILARSLADGEALRAVLANPYYLERLWFTLYQALLSTLLTVLAALPGALLFARFDFWGKRLLRSAFTIPFVMPTVVAAIGFLALVGPRGVTGLDLRGSLSVILLAHVFYNYAVVVRVVGAYLEALGPRLGEAAQMLGSPPWRVLTRLTLPLAAPAIVAAAALVFIFCFTSFGVIMILAPGPQFATLEVEIYRLTSRLRLSGAAVLVVAQLLVVSLVTLLYTRVQARLAVALKSEKRPLPRPAGAWRWLLALNLLVAGGLILAPLLTLLYATFWQGGGVWPSWRAFEQLAEVSQARTLRFEGAGPAVLNSLRFAASSMLLALLVGFAFAYAVVRGGWRWLDNLSLLPLATSAVTLGYGYLLAFPGLRASAWGLVLAHSLIAFPFVARSLLPAMRGLPPNLLGAARALGSSPFATLRRVELPLLVPALVVAASFAFAISMGEFGASLVLARQEFATVPVAIFDRLGRPGAANYGAALALSSVLMGVTGAVFVLFERFGQGEL